jgi:uncharacterized protein YycO
MRVGFSYGNSILSVIIKRITRSQASHSYIVFCVAGEELVVQANQHGVCCENYKTFKQHSNIVVEFELNASNEQEQKILSYALRQLLRPYDVLALLGFGWVLIGKALGTKFKQPFKNRAAYFCSELIMSSLKHGGFVIGNVDPELTSPEDLIQILRNNPQCRTVTCEL